MPRTARDTYLETEVRTATPQKLRLMLIEGALRFARQAVEYWDDPEHPDRRYDALARCHDIVSELYAAIRTDDLPVAGQVKSIYQFLFGQLALVTMRHDPKILQDVIEVLEMERETWRQVCEKMPEDPRREQGPQRGCPEISAAGMPAIEPQTPGIPHSNLPAMERFSLDA